MNKTPIDKLNDHIINLYKDHPLMALKERLHLATIAARELRINLNKEYMTCNFHERELSYNGKCWMCERNAEYYINKNKPIPIDIVKHIMKNRNVCVNLHR